MTTLFLQCVKYDTRHTCKPGIYSETIFTLCTVFDISMYRLDVLAPTYLNVLYQIIPLLLHVCRIFFPIRWLQFRSKIICYKIPSPGSDLVPPSYYYTWRITMLHWQLGINLVPNCSHMNIQDQIGHCGKMFMFSPTICVGENMNICSLHTKSFRVGDSLFRESLNFAKLTSFHKGYIILPEWCNIYSNARTFYHSKSHIRTSDTNKPSFTSMFHKRLPSYWILPSCVRLGFYFHSLYTILKEHLYIFSRFLTLGPISIKMSGILFVEKVAEQQSYKQTLMRLTTSGPTQDHEVWSPVTLA